MTDEFVKTMNSVADGTPRDIEEATDDTTFERKSKDLVKLYRVSDESGALEITEVGSYPLKRDMLDTNVSSPKCNIFIHKTIHEHVGCFHCGYWIWWYLCLGRQASHKG